MRHDAKRDDNESDIVKALESIGCTVYRMDRPVDLLCGYRAKNLLLEVKNPDGLNKITTDQKRFMAGWKGQVRIVTSPAEAIKVVTESYGRKK